MTALEATILRLTHETPSGGTCQIGSATFQVFYCSDIWEWEYKGVTYWDMEDLAKAMAPAAELGYSSSAARSRTAESKSRGSRAKRRRHVPAALIPFSTL